MDLFKENMLKAMKNRYLIVAFLCALGMGLTMEGQAQRQLHLTQYNMHQPFLNPASISSYNDISGALLYKHQWVGFDGAPTFQGLDFNMPIGETPSSVGLTAFNDEIGINQRTNIGLNYAYQFQVTDESYLSFGLTGSLLMMQSDHTKLDLQDEQDPNFAEDSPNLFTADFRFGTYYFQENFYLGFATPNLLKNRMEADNGGDYSTGTEFDPAAIHYYLHGGYQFELSEDWKLQPSAMLKFISGSPLQADINAQVLYQDTYGLGVGYRSSEIVNAFFNVRFARNFRLGYAYDFNFSEISTSSSGSHEVMLIYERSLQTEDVKVNLPRF